MKHLLSLLLLLVSTFTFAQNEDYRLFRDGVQYLYGHPDSHVAFGIRLDDICDNTYTYLADAYDCATEYPSLLVESSFAGSQVCQIPNFTSLRMKDNRLVTLFHRSLVGQFWKATTEDSTAIWAVVDSIKLMSVLGMEDSVKYISLHADTLTSPTLNTIRIGKATGLVSAVYFWDFLGCPVNFELLGTSAPEAGFQYPPAAEFLVPGGDQEIHFEEKNYAGGRFFDPGDSTYFQYHQYKLELENWTVPPGGDSLTYTYRGSKLSYRINTFGDRTPYDSILRDDYLLVATISRAEFAALGQQPGTMSRLFSEGRQQPEADNDAVTTYYVSERTCFGQRRSFGTYYEHIGGLAQYYSDGYLGNAYYAGIGIPFHRTGSFNITKERKLLYRKDGNGECGTPFDFSGIVATPVSTNVLPLDHAIRLFPNPVNEVATLRLPSNGSYDVSVRDLHGRLVAAFSGVNGDLGLDVQGFTAGVYIVSVARDGKLLGRRRLMARF